MSSFDPETAENHPDIEKQWAVKALHHAETYFKLISSLDAQKLKLTKRDDELYQDFTLHFPEINVLELDEFNQFKTEQAKSKWREFLKKYEDLPDFNFGTLLRNRAKEDYGQDNCFFVTRVQFYCIEIARNRLGYNSCHCKK